MDVKVKVIVGTPMQKPDRIEHSSRGHLLRRWVSQSSASQVSALSRVRGWSLTAEMAVLSIVGRTAAPTALVGQAASIATAREVKAEAYGLVGGRKNNASPCCRAFDKCRLGLMVVEARYSALHRMMEVATQAYCARAGRNRSARGKRR